MGIPLRVIEPPKEGAGYAGVEPGDMWPDEALGERTVMLPNRTVVRDASFAELRAAARDIIREAMA